MISRIFTQFRISHNDPSADFVGPVQIKLQKALVMLLCCNFIFYLASATGYRPVTLWSATITQEKP